MSKFMEIISYLNSIFYGEYWFISWGIVFLLFGVLVAVELPNLIKSINAARKRK